MWSGQATTSVSPTARNGRKAGCQKQTFKSRETRRYIIVSACWGASFPRAWPSAFLAAHRGHAALWCTTAAHSFTASICVPPLLPAL